MFALEILRPDEDKQKNDKHNNQKNSNSCSIW